jgi:hypothetical protein
MSDIGTDIFGGLEKKIKPLEQLKKHSTNEIVLWIKEALDQYYPESRKRAFTKLTNRSWRSLYNEILEKARKQNYEKIHELNRILDIDLLDFRVIERIGAAIDGTLGIIQKGDRGQIVILEMINSSQKDSRLESYLLYRRLGGRPRLSFGFLKKV